MSHTIAQVKAFPIGTVIPKTEGTLEKVYPIKTGESQYGPWKLQSFVVNDGAGEKIKGTLFDSEDISYLEGKHVSLISSGTNGKTKKQQGVELVASKQDGSPELSVKGKQGGIITGDQPNPAYMKATAPKAASPAPTHPAAFYQLDSGDAVESLNRLACFWLACWHKASMVDGLPPETKQSMASCLFIEGNKQGLAKAWPIEPAKAKEVEQAEDNPF